jgi:hypothetical protein
MGMGGYDNLVGQVVKDDEPPGGGKNALGYVGIRVIPGYRFPGSNQVIIEESHEPPLKRRKIL